MKPLPSRWLYSVKLRSKINIHETFKDRVADQVQEAQLNLNLKYTTNHVLV